MFVKEVLNDNPKGNAEAVNQAWRAAGMPGRISPTLVSRIRSRLGLAGNIGRGRRKKSETIGTGPGRPSGQPHAGGNGATPARARRMKSDLMDVEIDIDRVLMKVAEIGTLPAVEDALRKARRHLYAGLVELS